MISRTPLRMGRISYLNVLPIYHALEAGIIAHDYEIVSGPPALLNEMMAAGELQVSSCSCFEYARNPDKYYLLEDLSIGSQGPVMSVLLLSRLPLERLRGCEILISGESHTSVALLRILFANYWNIKVEFRTAQITSAVRGENPPPAFLAIGDEALRLRFHPDYPYRIDLAEAWREWTGLPFIFGLWVASKKAKDAGQLKDDPGELLRQGRNFGLSHMDIILDLTGHSCPLKRADLKYYYEKGLIYSLGKKEIEGLLLFYNMLEKSRLIKEIPELKFF